MFSDYVHHADGKCDSMSGDLYVEKCGWEGNDCKVMHDLYPLCRLYNASMLGGKSNVITSMYKYSSCIVTVSNRK